MGLRSRLTVPFVVILIAAAVLCVWWMLTLFMSIPSGPRTITVSKETTYVTGPLRPDGSVDFLAALNEHCREGVTPENNAAIGFWEAAGPKEIPPEVRAEFFRLLGIGPLPETGHYFVPFIEYLQAAEKGPPAWDPEYQPWREQMERKRDRAQAKPWSREVFPAVARWLDANEKPLAVLVAGLRRPRFYSPLVAKENGPLCQVDFPLLIPRDAAQLLVARAMLRVKQGKTDEACQDLLAAHRVARLAGQGPTLVSWLVASVVEQSACSGDVALVHDAALTNDQIRKFRGDLRGLPPLRSMEEAAGFGERLMGLDCICTLLQEKPRASNLSDLFGIGAGGDAQSALVTDRRVDWDQVLRIANERYDQVGEACRAPTLLEVRDRLTRLARDLDLSASAGRGREPTGLAKLFSRRKSAAEVSQQIGDFLAGIFMGAHLAAIRGEIRTRVASDMRDVAWALAEYRNDHGEYPQALKELSPKYMPEIPKDLFCDGDYHFQRRGKGYLLYSVGPNGKDDGGRSASDDPKKYEHAADPPDDIAIRTPEEKP
jgi:hypothetical protein